MSFKVEYQRGDVDSTTLNFAFKVAAMRDCILISYPDTKSGGKETSGAFDSLSAVSL